MTWQKWYRCNSGKWVIDIKTKKKYRNSIFIGEVYNKEKYSEYINNGGFDYLYDKVGLYDTLKSVTTGKAAAYEITNRWQELGPIQSRMLNFIENHDEVRVASAFYAGDRLLRLFLLDSFLMLNTAPFYDIFCSGAGGKRHGQRGVLVELTAKLPYMTIGLWNLLFPGDHGKITVSDQSTENY